MHRLGHNLPGQKISRGGTNVAADIDSGWTVVDHFLRSDLFDHAVFLHYQTTAWSQDPMI